MEIAKQRAAMPKGTNHVLDRRTVQNDNRNLLALLKPGMRVLDVGCGSGAITKGIIELVGERGLVVGIDASEALIAQARAHYGEIPGLQFHNIDLFEFKPEIKFDLITSARVLQWLNNPLQALEKMSGLLAPGGKISILDYNHEKVSFEPEIPQSMHVLYRAFLQWRSDAGFDNQIADKLEALMAAAGLEQIEAAEFKEVSTRDKESFRDEVLIWNKVAESRGLQLVHDGYITEEDRLRAVQEYQKWVDEDARKMELYLRAVTGVKLKE